MMLNRVDKRQETGIPLPKHIIVNREGLPEGTDPPGFEESEDSVTLGGAHLFMLPSLDEPFVFMAVQLHIYRAGWAKNSF